MITCTGNANLDPVQADDPASVLVFISFFGTGALSSVTGAASCPFRTGTGRSLAPVSFIGSEIITTSIKRDRALSGTLHGLHTLTPHIVGDRPLHGSIQASGTLAARLGRQRPLFTSIDGGLIVTLDFRVDDQAPTTFHIPSNRSELLLTAIVKGWVTDDVTYEWSFKAARSSGYEKLLSPKAKSTRFTHLMPYGIYEVTCTIVNGEGRVRSNHYSVLVDAPAV